MMHRVLKRLVIISTVHVNDHCDEERALFLNLLRIVHAPKHSSLWIPTGSLDNVPYCVQFSRVPGLTNMVLQTVCAHNAETDS